MICVSGNMIFAKRIKRLREEHGESQEDLAKIVGYKKQAVSHWETNGKVPRGKVLSILAQHYNTSSDFLLGMDNDFHCLENFEISSDERKLLERYRLMEEFQKDTMHKVAETIVPLNLTSKAEMEPK